MQDAVWSVREMRAQCVAVLKKYWEPSCDPRRVVGRVGGAESTNKSRSRRQYGVYERKGCRTMGLQANSEGAIQKNREQKVRTRTEKDCNVRPRQLVEWGLQSGRPMSGIFNSVGTAVRGMFKLVQLLRWHQSVHFGP